MKTIQILILFASIFATNATLADEDHRCAISWTRLSEKPFSKVTTFKRKIEIDVDSQTRVTLALDEMKSKISVHDRDIKNPSTFIEAQMACEKLNCKGVRLQSMEGKKTEQKLKITGGGYSARANLGDRTLFEYAIKGPKRDFKYVAYETSEGKPMGLEVSCEH